MCVDHSISSWDDGDVLMVKVVGELGFCALPCFPAASRPAGRDNFT